MSNRQGPHNSANALSTPPFGGINNSYSGRAPHLVRERPVPVVTTNARMPMQMQRKNQKPLGPDAIWGQYNNYRSNGLMGSAVAHVVVLALILGGSLIGHKVVPRVEQHETVTLIAPS